MISIAAIVEGEGEVRALPALLRRFPLADRVKVLPPIRVKRSRFLKNDDDIEFRRQLLLAAGKCGEDGWIIVLLDADDDCPAELGAKICERARQYVPHRRLSVVLTNREFEAWFIAAARSIHGKRGFSIQENEHTEAETPRDAKGWMREHMNGPYQVMLDQPAFAATIDLQQACENSRSFRKLRNEWQVNVEEHLHDIFRKH
jgi:hypothetical protein